MAANKVINNPPGQCGFTIGIGVTDRCNAACPHCYSRPDDGYHDLDFDLICALIETIPVRSINFGTGESILYSRFVELLRLLSGRGIELSLTTNGDSVAQLSDEDLRLFHDIDFSLDFPQEKINDSWRGEGAYRTVMKGIHRCVELGVEASIVACLIKENHAYMGKLAEKAVSLGLNLRVNVYKPVFTTKHRPSYSQFWRAIADMAEAAYFTACSEPIVNAAIGSYKTNSGSPCGKMSFRLHPDGKVVPCVYLKDSDVTIDDLIEDFDTQKIIMADALNLPIPKICKDCRYAALCGGGCAARRILGEPDQPDEFCFIVRNEHPQINAKWKESKGLVHEDYLCTMIFSG